MSKSGTDQSTSDSSVENNMESIIEEPESEMSNDEEGQGHNHFVVPSSQNQNHHSNSHHNIAPPHTFIPTIPHSRIVTPRQVPTNNNNARPRSATIPIPCSSLPFYPNATLSSSNIISPCPSLLSPNNNNNTLINHHPTTNHCTNINSEILTHNNSLLSEPIPTRPHNNPIVDAAIANERKRIQNLESLELNATLSELRTALKKERNYSSRLVSELTFLKSAAVAHQAEAEIFEECRINGLMRRLDCLQKEKGRIIVELEREEEMLTNTLQKKLNEVRREKSALEKQIEKEHLANEELKSQLAAVVASSTTSHIPSNLPI